MEQQAELPDVPYTVILPTVYGQMLVNRNDENQTNHLFKMSVSVHHQEILLLLGLMSKMKGDLVVADIGANIGAFTLGFSRGVGEGGKVHAFEPQRILCNMIAGSVALNSIENVYCHNMAVGDRVGRIESPQFDYRKPLNFGSIEFTAEQTETLEQPRGRDPKRVEHVPLTTIDAMGFEAMHLMKIDVEGLEVEVIAGARETIERCRPVLFVEFTKCDKQELRRRIEAHRYAVMELEADFLCIPEEASELLRSVGVK